uniref:Class II Aldolase Adducin Family Protein n=1 Tax=Florenciella sp. virus SA2 TaxID=3240092 RepID=A0AB39JAW9_9VIRU
MYKHLIIDFDDTLYDYSHCNDVAISNIFEYITTTFKIEKCNVIKAFNIIKKKFQNNVFHQASSHNKCIQFKKLTEELEIPISESIKLYDLYIEKFNDNICLFEDVENFLIFCKEHNIFCYLLTNNICYEQLNRLKQLNIFKYFKKIYTSEEYGIEKPDIKLFYSILQDNNIHKHEVAMIGDSYKNDIESVNLIDMYAFWLNNNKLTFNNKYCEFNDFTSLLSFFNEYYKELNCFIKLSKYCGERYDLVQAGGGNISFKLKQFLFIKSSGSLLSDIEYNKNYVGLNRNHIVNNIPSINSINKKVREYESKQICDNSVIFLKAFKPSIETTMHSLTKKYTLHIHPIQFLKICGLVDCEEILKRHFENICFIDYFTPGIDVAIELNKKYKNENIVFLKNHGIVITNDDINEIYKILNDTLQKLEQIINIQFNEYKLTNYISSLMNNITSTATVSYLSHCLNGNEIYKNDIFLKPFFPDKLVYCGINILKIKNIYDEDIEEIKSYISTYNEIPKIFSYKNNIYINSISLKKCMEIEALLKCHILSYNDANDVLNTEENNYLNNWDAEKYRKKL